MTKDSNKLRLGPLPQTEFVKLSVSIPVDVKVSLDRYAALHNELYGGKVDAAALIPHMLATFIQRDRGFKSLAFKKAQRNANPP